MNIQTKEDKDDRIIKANIKKISKKKVDTKKSEDKDKDDEDFLDIESGKNNPNGNTDCKTIVNNNISGIHNMNINKNLYNYKSTNYKFLKDEQKDLYKSNPVLNMNKKEKSDNNIDYIELKHPLDKSSSENDNKNDNIIKKENINVSSSMEERIKNYKNNENEHIEEDGVNLGNSRYEENDDMVNVGQSMTHEQINEIKNEQKDICIIFEIQSIGERHNINTKKDIKLNDLLEIFKNKIDMSPFEKPEFMFNGVYLIDYDKSISEYNIKDKSKINVYI